MRDILSHGEALPTRLRENAIFQENANVPAIGPDKPPVQMKRDGLLVILWRQRLLVAGCAAASLVLAIIYLICATPIYTSTARMSVRLATSRLTGEAQAISDSTAGNYLYTERELILSPSVLALAAQMPEVQPIVDAEDDPILYLQDNLDVEVGKRDTILSVSFSSPNRVSAAKVANGVVAAYMKYQTKPKPADTAELTRLADERQKLETAITQKNAQVTDLEKKFGILSNVTDRDSPLERRVAQLSQELSAAHLDTLKAQAELKEVQKAVEKLRASGVNVDAMNADSMAIGPDQEALIRTEMLQLQARYQDMRPHYLPDHPYLKDMRRRIDQLQVIYAGAVERRYLIDKQREQDLQASIDDQQKQAVDLSAKAAQYARLQGEIQNDRKVEEQLDSRKREIEMARDLGMLNIDPFDPAKPELKASHPRKRTTLPLALMFGLVLGGGLGYLRDWMDDRFRTLDEIPRAMAVPLLGTLPKREDFASPALLGQQALLEPESDVAEACRTIRTAIFFGAPKDRCRTLLITSPAPGDGKSTLASNLAITMAQSGKRVLLLDADLRLPSQNSIFHVSNETGLTALLTGEATLDQAIRTTPVEGLEVLPSGPKPHNPSEILNSSMFTELLEVLSDRYDQVIIDSPPVMGVADARIIAASCDMTVLVLRAEKSTRRLSELSRDGLVSVGANVLGIVINDVTRQTGASYGYYGYGRQRTRPASAARKLLRLHEEG